ncbi:MAG: pilin [Candidatus Parcubacteria bacterium]|nr:pilin [Candidatus Parcubacteria bacterium]
MIKFLKNGGLKIITILLTILIAPIAKAAWAPGTPLVPCTTDCTACDLLVLGQNVIDAIFYGAVLIAVGIIVWGGVVWLTSVGDPKKFATGKQMMISAITGLTIVVCAWLIVNTALWLLNGGDPGTWDRIDC